MDNERIIIAVVSYILGILTGYIIRCVIARDMESRNARMIVLLVVTTVWTISMVVELLNSTYHTNPMVHGLMGSIVGFFYKFDVKRDGQNN